MTEKDLAETVRRLGVDISARVEGARHGQHELKEEVRALREQVSLLRAPEGADPWFDKLCSLLERYDARVAEGLESLARGQEAVRASIEPLAARVEVLEAAVEAARPDLAQRLERLEASWAQALITLSSELGARFENARAERQALLEEFGAVSQSAAALVQGQSAAREEQTRGAASAEEGLRSCAESVRAQGDRTAALVERLDSAARERAADQLRLAMLQVLEELAALRKAIPEGAEKESLGFKLFELKETLKVLMESVASLTAKFSDISEVVERKRLMHRLDEVAKALAALRKSEQG